MADLELFFTFSLRDVYPQHGDGNVNIANYCIIATLSIKRSKQHGDPISFISLDILSICDR